MAASTPYYYAAGTQAAFSGSIIWTVDTIKVGLLAASYTPNYAVDSTWSSIDSHEVIGTGYTAGGMQITSPVLGVVDPGAANAWIANTSYSPNQVVGVSGALLVCITQGTSSISTPTFNTVKGSTTIDGTVVWACLGGWISYFTSTAVSWNPLSVTARYGILYDATSGFLIAAYDFGSATALTGPWSLQPDPVTGWMLFSG